jgi:hypothetical protein
MHATLSDLGAFFTEQQFKRAEAARMSGMGAFFTAQQFKRAEAARLSGLGNPHGHHGGGHGHGGRGPVFMNYGGGYDPYWVAPSPYLVISEVSDDDDAAKKKKKLLLGTAFRY